MTRAPVSPQENFEPELPFEVDIPKQRTPLDMPETEKPAISVGLSDRAQYLAKSLDTLEEVYGLAGYVKGINARKKGIAVRTSSSIAIRGAHERQANLMRTAKEQFARGAGYTALRNADGTYSQDIQDDLDLSFVSFKARYAGPRKEEARKEFKARLKKIAAPSDLKV